MSTIGLRSSSPFGGKMLTIQACHDPANQLGRPGGDPGCPKVVPSPRPGADCDPLGVNSLHDGRWRSLAQVNGVACDQHGTAFRGFLPRAGWQRQTV